MHRRCNDPGVPGYKHYGGRGIRVCDSWQDFRVFVANMGEKPSPEHSIDRIDVNGHYEPSNCRWATPAEQAQNKRNNVLTQDMAKAIREDCAAGESMRKIATARKISYACVKSVVRLGAWK